MLLKFGAENFFCFKEWVEVSLEISKKCPKEISKGKSVSNLLCVKGANGSGKTNALKIIAFLKHFCCDSFNSKPDEEIAVDTFFNNDKPACLYCDFTFNNITYSYELCLTKNQVISEKLSRKRKKFTPLFHREGREISFCTKEFSALNSFKQRGNASLISTAHQYEIDAISPIYDFFDSIVTNVNWSGRFEFTSDYKLLAEFYHNNPKTFRKVVNLLKDCDLGISSIKIHSRTDEKGKKLYFPLFYHDADVDNNVLSIFSQSLGTQTLFKLIPYYFYALEDGGILVIDEFDNDLHPHILPMMLKQFENEKINKYNGQMLFSTHNTEILEYMGKYRTVLFNKEKSESFGYRLDEIPGDIVRNDRLIAPLYNSGKIGGVPKL